MDERPRSPQAMRRLRTDGDLRVARTTARSQCLDRLGSDGVKPGWLVVDVKNVPTMGNPSHSFERECVVSAPKIKALRPSV